MATGPIAITLIVDIAGRRFPVTDLADASAKVCAVRDAGDFTASNFPDVLIRNAGGTAIGRVSYNGRVWSPIDDTVCLYDNRRAA